MESDPPEAVGGVPVEVEFMFQKDPDHMDVPVVGGPAQCPRLDGRVKFMMASFSRNLSTTKQQACS